MKILSIDLPWSSSSGTYGFAWLDISSAHQCVDTDARPGNANAANAIFSTFAAQHGKFDVILIDQPIGTGHVAMTGRYRPVERAFTNSAFVTNGPKRIQGPRFQPGARHALNGFNNAQMALRQLGNSRTVVVESFPQLSILPLIDFARRNRVAINAITRLAAHKNGANRRMAAGQLVSAFAAWSGRAVTGDAQLAQPDAIDALLALLPLLEVLSPSLNAQQYPPCWLHAAPPGAPGLPSTVPRAQKAAVRASWMSSLITGSVGQPGIRTGGILSLLQPGWPPPTAGNQLL